MRWNPYWAEAARSNSVLEPARGCPVTGAYIADDVVDERSVFWGTTRLRTARPRSLVVEAKAGFFGPMKVALLDGVRVTVSMAGHHRIIGTRVALQVDECDAWIQALLGQEWADKSYHAGALSGVKGRLTTVFYYLYLDSNHQPKQRPPSSGIPDEILVRPDVFDQ